MESPDPTPIQPPSRETGALWDYLAQRDIPCPGCGYNLRGLRSEVCPECRQELRLTLQLAEPRLGSLLAVLSGLLAGLGASVVCLSIVTWASLVWGGPGRRMLFPIFYLPAIVGLINGPAAVLLGRTAGRRWFRELAPRARSIITVLSWGQLPVWIAVFMSCIR